LGYYYYVVPSHKWQPLGIRLGRLMLLFLRAQGVKDAVIERFFECFTNYCKMAIAEYSDLEEDDTAVSFPYNSIHQFNTNLFLAGH